MSNITPCSPVRRTIARVLYTLAALLTLLGLPLLVVDFGDNYWVYALFMALALLIAGNAIGSPRCAQEHAVKP